MTEFTQKVFHIVSRIPRGKVATYGQIAMLLGDPHCSRAVGNALHQNRDPVRVPCHRVVNGEGRLAREFGMGGPTVQKERLETEGVAVTWERDPGKGKTPYRVDLGAYGWDGRISYRSLNSYLQETFGGKCYKLALDGGFTCPNRDGSLGRDGCIFCSAGGSGDFAQDRTMSITEQLEAAKGLVADKLPAGKPARYIAYLQAFTNTYGPIERLRAVYKEALEAPEVVALSIATRPDCVDEEIVDLLVKLREACHKPIWVELGLQTIHEETARYIRRGYGLEAYERALRLLRAPEEAFPVITHVILGLPGETKKDMLETVAYVGACRSEGIKLQLLHVLKGTDLAVDYEKGKFRTLEEEEYCLLIQNCLAILPKETVIHRITGDGDKRNLIAPLWSGNKKQVLNHLKQYVIPTDQMSYDS